MKTPPRKVRPQNAPSPEPRPVPVPLDAKRFHSLVVEMHSMLANATMIDNKQTIIKLAGISEDFDRCDIPASESESLNLVNLAECVLAFSETYKIIDRFDAAVKPQINPPAGPLPSVAQQIKGEWPTRPCDPIELLRHIARATGCVAALQGGIDTRIIVGGRVVESDDDVIADKLVLLLREAEEEAFGILSHALLVQHYTDEIEIKNGRLELTSEGEKHAAA